MEPLEDLSRRTAAGTTNYTAQAAVRMPWFIGSGRGALTFVLVLLAVLTVVRLFTVAWLMDLAWRWSVHQPLPDAIDRLIFPGARAARPIDRAAWLTAADYPRNASIYDDAAFGPRGVSVIRLIVSPQGRVVDCWTERSSGSAMLDDAACDTIMPRARFVPARDAAGRAVGSEVVQRVRWTPPALALTSDDWLRTVQMGGRGSVPQCAQVTANDTMALSSAECAAVVKDMAPILAAAKAEPVGRLVVRYRTVADRTPPAEMPALPPASRLLGATHARLFMTAGGAISGCSKTVEAPDADVRKLLAGPTLCDRNPTVTIDGDAGTPRHLLLETRISLRYDSPR